MPTTPDAAFSIYLAAKTPSQTERDNARRHRGSVERCLLSRLDAVSMRETGSLRHGTAVRGHCDGDYFLWLKLPRPSADRALEIVRNSLKVSFPRSSVRVSRPAVKITFSDDGGKMEIVPAYYSSVINGYDAFDIPDPSTGGWMKSSPSNHLEYVNEVNARVDGAKSFARLLKAWKYYNNVPISSFYLEMRAAKWADDHKPLLNYWDLVTCLEYLASCRLAAMNDPAGAALGRIHPCSTETYRGIAISKVELAATRARRALDAARDGRNATAFSTWKIMLGPDFPTYTG
ncbi:nucleotidyltransferase [Frankia sp. Mgl5]|uniref:nucleotidyltransferase domain-containing protein n=1 Tax=Frankia sp. Mgl5 TaxID=2933793 RepID=UPI00200BF00E|nr:nucleotidyltransferase [Frankia sp. Mgl5]MCK9926222.1 nucleotidyltransferase [Frankia sp. Mgl5]